MSRRKVRITDMSRSGREPLAEINTHELMHLPYPYENIEEQPELKKIREETADRFECDLDGYMAIGIPRPRSKAEEEERIDAFLTGLKRLLNENDNWPFHQPLQLSLENCAKCQTCSEVCHVFLGSGRQEIYRPTYRAEVLRRIIDKYLKPGGRLKSKLSGRDIELNWELIARLAESAYRCTLCRHCAYVCPMGVDNGLISREIRKLFSQEMDIAPAELHKSGSVNHLKTGSTSGMNRAALLDNLEFIEDEIEEKIGRRISIPVDEEGADILLIHSAGEILSWPENPEAFAILFDAAGIKYTLSSDLCAYDAANYGMFYDDVQLARVAKRQAEAARKLNVKKIVIGECGPAHKAFASVADRLLTDGFNIPRESCLTVLLDIVKSKILSLDPARNDFPITLHDPCNMVRLMGIVEPQRKILREIAPRFREMNPHGTENYCCGGGGGFSFISSTTFPQWQLSVSSRMKFKQILETFTREELEDKDLPKYICAPCSNCKGTFREILSFYDATARHNIHYGGLAELIVNAMTEFEEPFIDWDEKF